MRVGSCFSVEYGLKYECASVVVTDCTHQACMVSYIYLKDRQQEVEHGSRYLSCLSSYYIEIDL